jgi:hypothetical protein
VTRAGFATAGAVAAGPVAAGRSGVAGAAVGADVEPGAPTRASGVPTGTVSPSFTSTSRSTPSYGLGISESTLSVDTSYSGSSNATGSPTFFSQRPTVPSVTVSPSLGIVTSCSCPGPSACGGATDSSTGAVRVGVASAGSPMRASGVPTGTVSPGRTSTSRSTPSYGLGISESTLSVDTSKSGSSNATGWPTSLSQRPTVPSVTVSPSFGMVTS